MFFYLPAFKLLKETYVVLPHDVEDIVLTAMEGLDCPRSLMISLLIRNREWVQLMQCKCTVEHYLAPEAYFSARVATDLLRKLEVSVPGLDPEQAAIENWRASERQCFTTNRRLNELWDFGTLLGEPGPMLVDFLRSCRKKVRDIVGPGPSEPFGVFGPGASQSDPVLRSTLAHKLVSQPTLTSGACSFLPYLGRWAHQISLLGHSLALSRGDQFFTVPKTALTHRGCAKNPSINAFFQRGLGIQLAARLKEVRIDLSDGARTHVALAKNASVSGEYATIDLSNASDTVSESLVRILFPDAWFAALSNLRAEYTQVAGRWQRLEKFSAMGNGYTFEVETIVFLSIAMAVDSTLVPGRNLFVFGDDIIIPSRSYRVVTSALRFCGFSLNSEKSFSTGPFRESCGGDFWLGQDVRPIYLKKLPTEPHEWVSLANQIQSLRDKCPVMRMSLQRAWLKTLDQLPASIRRLRGPRELGDLVIHDSPELWSVRYRNGIRWFKCWRPAKFVSTPLDRFCPDTQLSVALYGVVFSGDRSWMHRLWGSRDHLRALVHRNGVSGYKIGRVSFS
ncbi:TPA_asm: RNA-directed RNA polymerase [ssRNA phage SRR7976301_8]|uniref:RNA-directed RNA polymerase n=1 Tax=ssRNA phage SRR7976301_8 TaxID=2786669 RepID=A0A8S5L0I2_9VIRU|nr:RNA-directed RNA polymerase [ssRNA phage SRR7976301_8]DAD51120.1 TPA_asm: RNA-directed RNA polymerase [ssRNA phage SRR7976301_8]